MHTFLVTVKYFLYYLTKFRSYRYLCVCPDATLKLYTLLACIWTTEQIFLDYSLIIANSAIRSPFQQPILTSLLQLQLLNNVNALSNWCYIIMTYHHLRTVWCQVYKIALFKIHPRPSPLKFLTVSNWLTVNFHYFLIVPKVHILNTFSSLSIDLTLFPCRNSHEPVHASYYVQNRVTESFFFFNEICT